MNNNDDIILDIPVVIKSHISKAGLRKVAVEASNEIKDLEGDIIVQKALLASADTFLQGGHLDIDHIPDIGHLMGIPNPDQYIIGYPTKVFDLGSSRTGVEGVIFKSGDGTVDPDKNIYDRFWNSLTTVPPTRWRASVYGQALHTSKSKDANIIDGFRWKNLAFTQHPVNDAIEGSAHVVKAKAFLEYVKSHNTFADTLFNSRLSLMDEYSGHILHTCPHTEFGKNLCVATIREHFEKCRHLTYDSADIHALALKSLILRKK